MFPSTLHPNIVQLYKMLCGVNKIICPYRREKKKHSNKQKQKQKTKQKKTNKKKKQTNKQKKNTHTPSTHPDTRK